MAARTVTCLLCFCFVSYCSSQVLNTTSTKNQGLCKSMSIHSPSGLSELTDCVVVVGNLQVSIFEKTTSSDFQHSFPNLREVTGFLVVYRLRGLESLGHLFPNLARIRGQQLLNNYALIIHDIMSLREIGLYGLLKIDRGGVIIWGVPQACFYDTIDWKTIAPRSRHVISPPDEHAHCKTVCTCSSNSTVNHCWNNRKCQVFLDGPESEKCNDQCLGCRKTNSDMCSLCRYYTYRGRCVPECPADSIILPNAKYCISHNECESLQGWIWNNTCVFECPIDYVVQNSENETTCIPCTNCQKTCEDLVIQTTSAIQSAQRCVYINGSLVIHLRAVPEAMDELRTSLSRIQEVSDYIVIYGSLTISSLDFLSSLRRIHGHKLKSEKYSLLIYDMLNLQTLFKANVTNNLRIDRGSLKMYDNPILCVNQIEEIRPLFPVPPNEIDIPLGMNGYSGACEEVFVGFQIRVVNETMAVIMFSTIADPDAHYSLLYLRLPSGTPTVVVPDTCSESEWFVVNVATNIGYQYGIVELTSLRPASTYAVCIETYDPLHSKLARSSIAKFSTLLGTPEPPFFVELVAFDSNVVLIHWVDHKDYHPHITHYELDVSLIEHNTRDAAIIDHCRISKDFSESDYSRHAVVMRPPPDYTKGCESMCGILSSVPAGALVQEYFDICSHIDCNSQEAIINRNSSYESYVRTLVLNFSSPRNQYQVGGLAPFRDYRFRLRSCILDLCSRSARGVVRTLVSQNADVPSIIYVDVNEHGWIAAKWDPPKVTNGPVLAYTLEVLPYIQVNPLVHLLPQVWCVQSNQTSLAVKAVSASVYFVRVCSRTLASSSTCSAQMRIAAVSDTIASWWWTGVVFGVLIYIASIVIGYLWRSRRIPLDLMPLVESTSTLRNESEPPSKMFSDFMPLYFKQIRDTQIS